MSAADAALIAAAGFGAGIVNGLAGGGSLVSFPALLAIGVPSLAANVTSAVGIWPGYLGGVAAFRSQLRDQRDRLRLLGPAALGGAVVGGVALLLTSERAFESVAPFLVLGACALFAAQPLIAGRVQSVRSVGHGITPPVHAAVFLAGVYGAYFGAGLGVILLAVLGLALSDPLGRINGLRSALALGINSIALVVFAVAAPVRWGEAGLLAVTSFAGGYLGARTSLRISPALLRAVVIALGLAAGLGLLL